MRTLEQRAQEILSEPNPAARDWAGFFKALGELLLMLAPIILPLLTKEEAK